jgi:predicted acetyltransferase
MSMPETTEPAPLRIRTVDPDTDVLESWVANAALVFKDPAVATPERLDFRRTTYRTQRLSGAFDGTRLVGTFRSWDTTLTVPGGSLAADAISSVTVLPTHRRRGALRAMMRADLDRAAQAGTPAAILIASEGGIYGRYGFAPSVRTATWTLDPARARFRPEVPRSGVVEVVATADLRPVVEAVYARSRRAGAMDRAPVWWDVGCGVVAVPGEPAKPKVGVLHRDDAGGVDGYLTYRVEEGWADWVPTTVVHVEDLQCATPAAYVALWRYLAELDLVAGVRAEQRAVDEPLPWLLVDPRAARLRQLDDFIWTRLLDPAAALSARRYEAAGEVVLELLDEAGYAGGRYRLTAEADTAGACERTAVPAEVTVTVEALSQVWLGAGGLSAAAVAGRAVEHTDGALDRLDRLLRTAWAPWASTWF